MKKGRDSNITEQAILDTAREIFYINGYFGTRMQDIADKVGINKAMLHYYFRSKDRLFGRIFHEGISELFDKIMIILDNSKSTEDKIRDLINGYIDFISLNPYLPAFVIHELNHNREFFDKTVADKIKLIPTKFISQFNKDVKAGKIKPINPQQLIINLISLCIFPFIARHLLEIVFDMNDKQFIKFIEERKQILPDLILYGIKKS